jgi:hypothetical protein
MRIARTATTPVSLVAAALRNRHSNGFRVAGEIATTFRPSQYDLVDATYANPNPLPFTRAEAARDGKNIKLFFELTAGGYNGSTYTLTYDPVNDVLRGVYFQAVAQQSFDVYFTRSQ